MTARQVNLSLKKLSNADPQDWATHEVVLNVKGDWGNRIERRLCLVAHKADGEEIIRALMMAVAAGVA
jgi:hypothetical protein